MYSQKIRNSNLYHRRINSPFFRFSLFFMDKVGKKVLKSNFWLKRKLHFSSYKAHIFYQILDFYTGGHTTPNIFSFRLRYVKKGKHFHLIWKSLCRNIKHKIMKILIHGLASSGKQKRYKKKTESVYLFKGFFLFIWIPKSWTKKANAMERKCYEILKFELQIRTSWFREILM
jgi:hypothetical protein